VACASGVALEKQARRLQRAGRLESMAQASRKTEAALLLASQLEELARLSAEATDSSLDGRVERAARKQDAALAAALALPTGPDCVVMAHVVTRHVEAALRGQMRTLKEDLNAAAIASVVALWSVCDAHLRVAVAGLRRRMSAGTLAPGRLLAHEEAYGRLRCGKEFSASKAAHAAPCIGLEAYICVGVAAAVVLKVACVFDLDTSHARAYVDFVSEALEWAAAPRPSFGSALANSILIGAESLLVRYISAWLADPNLLPSDPTLCARLLAALSTVQASAAYLARQTVEEELLKKQVCDSIDEAPARFLEKHARACAGCARRAARPDELKWCSSCRRAFYCTKECQVAHWKEHKAACKATRSSVAAGGAGSTYAVAAGGAGPDRRTTSD
jgi:hypothetical protein